MYEAGPVMYGVHEASVEHINTGRERESWDQHGGEGGGNAVRSHGQSFFLLFGSRTSGGFDCALLNSLVNFRYKKV